MKNQYIELVKQTFEFPQEEFKVEDGELYFHDIHLMEIVRKYGTPLKLTYLPKISSQIQKAKRIFNVAIAKHDYKGNYNYCYCTKSSHFEFILHEALKNDIHLETSSAFDIPIIKELYKEGKFTKQQYVICNGYKRPLYLQYLSELINEGFNAIPILDNKNELTYYEKHVKRGFKLGIRIAAFEQPDNEFYTSRLGIRAAEILDFYKTRIKSNAKMELKMLHFFVNTGIKDNAYYWSELSRCVNMYCELRKICPTLDSLNIGGGFPIKTSMDFNYDYE
ncbi:MAG: arginine decarboxylase, partial [Bacteroidia bacterium]|nr:arginine decarboxylase [Bacteroidia bacterium]